MNENTTFDNSDLRNTLPRFTPDARKANQALVDLLGEIAKRKKATPAQMRWHGCWRKNHGLFQSRAQQN